VEHIARTGEEEKCIPGSGGNALRKDTFRPREEGSVSNKGNVHTA